ncbi:snare protein syntaxin-like protein 18/UFE1 [Xylona heveae TC161]|uniref:Snare protein syntaxin-like protein 18/UFE1 n=1 Tax=Xylona heveae (strain CBS 132557 / TC161) TaxID=1328760 RepID=A0A165IY08_XYLHT|nr:snare protein syntaxin-like protein 18/UFE1 [Xylona heveae TC161]KZF25530.1 snare protein syntaxin-like protein 18/UFE1 [Xylona heveae TC161]
MADITSLFGAALQRHDVSLGKTKLTRTHTTDEFLKEAYRIESHISSLHAYLRSIRQSYLSTSLPPRRTQLGRANSLHSPHGQDKERQYLTDANRDEVDAESKAVLRQLNAAIRNLSDAEQLRQNTEATLTQRRRAKHGLGAIGRWAAGGGRQAASPEEEMDEARANGIKVHRESVLWYLRRKLEECGELQRSMMETRLTREVEKSKSALYKARGARGAWEIATGTVDDASWTTPSQQGSGAAKAALMDTAEKEEVERQLSPEQLQLFAQENQNMLKHYEDTLDQVRMAERSLIEISELQTTLATNLATQSAHVDQLVADSDFTTVNVGGGNKELKRASERASTARMVFYAACGLSAFLITWDLLI